MTFQEFLKSNYLLSIGIFDDWYFEKNNPKKKEITIRFSEI